MAIYRKENKNYAASILYRPDEEGETPVVNSRYSIVMATSKRARQIIGGAEPLVDGRGKKPLSIAVEELNKGKVKIMPETPEEEEAEE